MASVSPADRGFTLIELLVVLTITVIVLGLGVPSFNDYLARKRMEGTFNELQTDLQFARSEAVARNQLVRMTFGTGCYVIHTLGSAASSCTQTAPSAIGAGAIELRTVQLTAGGSAQLVRNDALDWIEFEPLRGGAKRNTGGTLMSVNVNSTAGSWQLRADVTVAGRVHGCSPGGSMKGHAPCS